MEASPGVRRASSPRVLEDDDRSPFRQRVSRDLDRRRAGREIGLFSITARNSSSGAMFRLILGVLKCMGITMCGPMASSRVGRSLTSIVGLPPAAASTMSAPLERGQLGLGERVTQVAQEHQVQVFGPEMNDRHFVFGQAFGGFENVDRLELNAAEEHAFRGKFERSKGLERRDDLAEMAVVAVVLVADHDEVGRLGDGQVSARVGRSIRVDDDPQSLGLEEKRRVAKPGDVQAGSSAMGDCASIAFRGVLGYPPEEGCFVLGRNPHPSPLPGERGEFPRRPGEPAMAARPPCES